MSQTSRHVLAALLSLPICFASVFAYANGAVPEAEEAAATGGAGDDEARLALGREVFTERAQPACAICHTLEDAGAAGEIGPILDSMRPSYDVVYRAITQGIGPMMPYDDHLSEEELDAVAFYVSTVTSD